MQNLLKVNILIGHPQRPYDALLDSGADKNCVSEGFCNSFEVTIERNTVEDTVVAANGERLKVLGEVKIPFSWVCFNGATNSAKFPFYVVKDLQVGMLICERYIAHLRVDGLHPLLAPVLLASRSQKAKQYDMQRTQQATTNAKVREAKAAAQRKAEREALPPKCLSRSSSMVGGSETTADSRSSSITGGSSASSASSA